MEKMKAELGTTPEFHPEGSGHLEDQPWYDYQECLSAVAQMDKAYKMGVGEVFMVKISPTNYMDHLKIPVSTFFWALKISDDPEPSERYRMCLYPEPLHAQVVLRGLPVLSPAEQVKKSKMRRLLVDLVRYTSAAK